MELLYNFPVYESILNEDSVGIYAVSLVNNPAMEVNFIACSKDKEKKDNHIKCNILDDEQHIIMAVIARADFPFLQYNEIVGYYYTYFSKDTLKEVAQRLLKSNFQNNINIEHTDTYVDGVEMRELFLKDVGRGINPIGFEEVEDGSLMVTYKILNDDIWSAIKMGVYKSISLEGFFPAVEVVCKQSTEIDNVEDLENYLNDLNK